VTRRSTVLTATDRTARQVVLIGAGENAPQALLDDTHTTVTLSAAAPPLWATMRRYRVTGIEHIFLGYDHIAFLIAIVLWAQRLWPVIKIVTAFTIAHSVTLSFAALQIVVVPSTIVEPAIAASIAADRRGSGTGSAARLRALGSDHDPRWLLAPDACLWRLAGLRGSVPHRRRSRASCEQSRSFAGRPAIPRSRIDCRSASRTRIVHGAHRTPRGCVFLSFSAMSQRSHRRHDC
jgi:HupE / UreJ protein